MQSANPDQREAPPIAPRLEIPDLGDGPGLKRRRSSLMSSGPLASPLASHSEGFYERSRRNSHLESPDVQHSLSSGGHSPRNSAHPPGQPGDDIVESQRVHYEDRGEEEKAQLQIAFNQGISKDFLVCSTAYKSVKVLLLSWERDDLEVEKEVQSLSDVFTDVYSYDVTRELIKERQRRNSQTQINAIVSQWVDKHDEPNTLLIVYYAGHGRPGDLDNPGEQIDQLHLSGTAGAFALRNRSNTFVWNKTEDILREAQNDVLQIFDCCYAGALGHRDGSTRLFEMLAASDTTTPTAGEESFTTALIFALKKLADQAPFTTLTLANTIKAAPKFRDTQTPVLLDRTENWARQRVVLRPFNRKASGPSSPVAPNPSKSILQGDILTLKLSFDVRPSETDMRKLTKSLCENVIYPQQLHVNGVIWGGIQYREEIIASRVGRHWRSMSRYKSGDTPKAYSQPFLPGILIGDLKQRQQDFAASSAARRQSLRSPKASEADHQLESRPESEASRPAERNEVSQLLHELSQ